MQKARGTITIAPEVLVTIARLTALAVPGVASTSPSFVSSVVHLLDRKTTDDGVEVTVEEDRVSVDLHLVVEEGVNLHDLSEEVQSAISRAIHDIVGMTVQEVNVFIEDVAPPLNSTVEEDEQ